MKLVYFLLVLFLCSTLIFGCKKKNEDKDSTPDTEVPVLLKPFKIALDGTPYENPTVSISHISGYIGLETVVADTLKFGLSMPDSIAVGTHPINSSSAFRVTHTDDNFATMYYSTTGAVTILTHDKTAKKISGTFSCNLTRINPSSMKTINSGEFNISY